MRNSVLHLVFELLVIALFGACEELCPKFGGVGLPLLMVATAFVARRRQLLPAAIFAIAAGACEDALSGLSAMTSPAYFLGFATLVNRFAVPRVSGALAYPLYQVWLAVWVPSLAGSVWLRMLLAVPVGAATAFAVFFFLDGVSGKAALDEAG